MCGIAGVVHLDGQPIPSLAGSLRLMDEMIAHRGPDGHGQWTNAANSAGLAHRRLAILDLSPSGAQPMVGPNGASLVHNGEVYNYIELRRELEGKWPFKSGTDTEIILAAYEAWGDACLDRFRGMWSFAIWDPKRNRLFASRDRFGIKPFYYAQVGRMLYFASEIKAILPFLPDIKTNPEAFAEYVTLQQPLSAQTMFDGVKQLMPAESLVVENGQVKVRKYWDVTYAPDRSQSARAYADELRGLLEESLALHLRSDVPVGAYVSGGIDSSLVAIMAARHADVNRDFFHGKFTQFPGYDESGYAEIAAKAAHGRLHQIDITAADFAANLSKVIYHLDHPVAGVGSFPQYMVSQLAGKHVKVVLGGQGGDEVFGGYARYLIGYFEQALRASIMGERPGEKFDVSLADLLPRIGLLREYVPTLRWFLADNLFGPIDERYFALVNRGGDLSAEIDLEALPLAHVRERFYAEFNAPGVGDTASFDKMTRFDFRFLLPALLQVEDRMGMAHGLELRVPLLDHPVVECAARMPLEVKFAGGEGKAVFKQAFGDVLPPELLQRRDKMGFPVPMREWVTGELNGWVRDTLSSGADRPWINRRAVLANLDQFGAFSRKLWGLLSLEHWYQNFHDQGAHLRKRAANLEPAFTQR